MDEHFSRHVEEGDGQSHTLPHEEYHQQQDNLKGWGKNKDQIVLFIKYFLEKDIELHTFCRCKSVII